MGGVADAVPLVVGSVDSGLDIVRVRGLLQRVEPGLCGLEPQQAGLARVLGDRGEMAADLDPVDGGDRVGPKVCTACCSAAAARA
ncbi:hypothetical protein [Streptomyces sp. NPDC058394]|uniref:hypothetical protein n=1 Tax=Streptomyces sp. NPDC058394 TaxID=3346477 RepID=UPI00364A75CE